VKVSFVAMAKKQKKSNSKTVSNSNPEPSIDVLKKYYRDMLMIRRFEEKAGQLYGMGLIGARGRCDGHLRGTRTAGQRCNILS
jgi:TPP-dependent pyruvate/acetoin dehydrogenase alpha subunit